VKAATREWIREAALLETQEAPAEIEGARGAGGGDEFGEEAEAAAHGLSGRPNSLLFPAPDPRHVPDA